VHDNTGNHSGGWISLCFRRVRLKRTKALDGRQVNMKGKKRGKATQRIQEVDQGYLVKNGVDEGGTAGSLKEKRGCQEGSLRLTNQDSVLQG